jgi:uncharacterized protein YcfJ
MWIRAIVGASLACVALILVIGCQSASHTSNGAALGTGLGALAGGIIGHQSGHTAGGAIVGAAAGALAGGLVGNAADAREERDAAVAHAAYMEQVRQSLTNVDLIRMAQSGLGDDVIITAVQTRGGQFDLSPDGMIQLKQQGVSDRVIQAVQQASTLSRPTTAVAVVPPPERVGFYVSPRPYGPVYIVPRRRWRRWY